MKVIKHSGNIVEFEPEKLKRSLLKSGAEVDLVEKVLKKITSQIYDGIATKQIYKLAFASLKKESSSHAARYNLRAAIQLLGPAGFFFEKYVSRLFKSQGYQTITNLVLQGKCVNHEIDVLLKKDNIVSMVECKFHSSQDAISDVKIPLYILSRFNDLKERNQIGFTQKDRVEHCWIVTNNRFSDDAKKFGLCAGLNLLSWDYPLSGNIRHFIDNNHLYPITCLTTLTLEEKNKLLVMNVILVNEIIDNREKLEHIGLSSNRIKNVIKEVSELCNIK